jgi:fructokinase
MVVWCIGEVIWDIFPNEEHLGGAALNFAANLHRLGAKVILISGVGKDDRGRQALEEIRGLGMDVSKIAVVDQPTGIAMVEAGPGEGDQSFVISRPAAYDAIDLDPTLKDEVAGAGVDWIYVGTLLQTNPEVERFTTELVANVASARVFYDLNLRDGHWDPALVKRLSRLSSVVKLNESEAERLSQLTQPGVTFELQSFCRWWAKAHEVDVMCVTLGCEGSLISTRTSVVKVPGFLVDVRDTVGAGDAFAAGFLYSYQKGRTFLEAARFANALGACVTTQAGAMPPWTIQEVMSLMSPETETSEMTSFSAPREHRHPGDVSPPRIE